MGPLYAESAFKGLKSSTSNRPRWWTKGKCILSLPPLWQHWKWLWRLLWTRYCVQQTPVDLWPEWPYQFWCSALVLQKTYALHTKLRILRQQTEKSPVTIGAYGQLTINNQLDLDLNPDLDFSHRLTYTAQALVSESLARNYPYNSPTLIHKNLRKLMRKQYAVCDGCWRSI